MTELQTNFTTFRATGFIRFENSVACSQFAIDKNIVEKRKIIQNLAVTLQKYLPQKVSPTLFSHFDYKCTYFDWRLIALDCFNFFGQHLAKSVTYISGIKKKTTTLFYTFFFQTYACKWSTGVIPLLEATKIFWLYSS